jgi:hypothetical protein
MPLPLFLLTEPHVGTRRINMAQSFQERARNTQSGIMPGDNGILNAFCSGHLRTNAARPVPSVHQSFLLLFHYILFLPFKYGNYTGQLRRYSDGLWSGRSRFESLQEQEIFVYSTASRLALGPTQPPIKWVPSGVRRLGHEAYHSLPPSIEVKNDGAIPPSPNMSSWRGA